MLKALVLIFAMNVPQPGAFRFVTEDDVTIKMDGVQLKPNKTYMTQPLNAPKEIEFEVSWKENDKINKKIVTLEITPGYLTAIKFSTPKQWISHKN